MLPEALSNGACSLVPDQDRLAVTVELEFEGAKVRRTAFHRSVIRSRRAAGLPAGGPGLRRRGARRGRRGPSPSRRRAGWPRRSQEAREAQGALAVESQEPEFAFSREGHVTELVWSEQTEAHRLIEHLMIAANEAVATLLETRRLPALYRVHERPEPARVERLVDQLASLDVPTPALPETMTPQQGADLVADIAHLVDQEVRRRGHGRAALTSLVLRTLKQAHYSPKNVGHAGLRSARYCHFTSPIRRYPDLDLPPRAAGRDRRRRGRAARLGHGVRGRVVLDARARRDGDRAPRGRHRALLPARGRAVRERLAHRVRGRGGGHHRRGRVRRLRPLRGDAARAPPARRLVGAQRARDDARGGRSRATCCGSATRSSCRSSGSTPRAGAWTSRPSSCPSPPAPELRGAAVAGSSSRPPGAARASLRSSAPEDCREPPSDPCGAARHVRHPR